MSRSCIGRSWPDVGSRSILVGFPERVHVAFDANDIRLAKAWHGRFFDASASGKAAAERRTRRWAPM